MNEAPAYDVYLSYNPRDAGVARELEQYLLKSGVSVWRDEEMLEPGADWQSALASALSQAGFVAVCVGPSGLATGQLHEIEAADARAATEPDLRETSASARPARSGALLVMHRMFMRRARSDGAW